MKIKNVLIGSLLLRLMLGGAPAQAGKDCGDLLGLRAYNCTATDGVSFSSSGVLAFGPAASQVQGVQGIFDQFTFGPCYCGAKGNLRKPQIEGAVNFMCRDLSDDTFLLGTAANKRINQGTLITGADVYFFACTEIKQ